MRVFLIAVFLVFSEPVKADNFALQKLIEVCENEFKDQIDECIEIADGINEATDSTVEVLRNSSKSFQYFDLDMPPHHPHILSMMDVCLTQGIKALSDIGAGIYVAQVCIFSALYTTNTLARRGFISRRCYKEMGCPDLE